MLARKSIYINLKNHNIVITLAINNVLFIKIKINTLLVNFSLITYRIVQREIIIKVLDPIRAITLITMIINYSF